MAQIALFILHNRGVSTVFGLFASRHAVACRGLTNLFLVTTLKAPAFEGRGYRVLVIFRVVLNLTWYQILDMIGFMYTRNCSKCKIEFQIKNKTQYLCKPCNSKASSEWNKNNPEKFKLSLRVSKYKISKKQFQEMLDLQGNKCKICESDLKPGRGTHIDHDHATGNVRGVLCNYCNLALGHAKDDPKILQAMIDYLA